ncbi:hypothetical protein FZZ93_16910 [Halomonas eurihalina]|uniref:DUF7281 domain-containing protein n=1 Tax=Halomonas eurihalina TaxID=42566 RepID=A0A5D9CJ14_HALER|nr:hypothetical protein [Halomonas eurihalina]MDR5858458.1 hypothetical protein [Halomonas eurihalina]TZG31664.1 hypothetical protein FZZ93_16910 [Halomonas eurihalina]
MNEALSPKTHRWLSEIHDTLHRQSCVEKKLQLKTMQEFRTWCSEHEIDLDAYRRGQVVRFDRILIARVQDRLDSLGHPPLGTSTKGKTTAEQAALSDLEDKGRGERPRTRRVLLNTATAGSRPGIVSGDREILDVDWRDLDLSAFDVLLMIENLDSFYDFTSQIPEMAAYQRPLVTYRGDEHYSRGFSKLAEAWRATGKAFLAIGDFDPKGVGIILGSGASQMLLPPLSWLRERATVNHVPEKQVLFQPRLRRYRDQLPAGHSLKDYLAILLDEQRGLKQQWFGDALVSVEIPARIEPTT